MIRLIKATLPYRDLDAKEWILALLDCGHEVMVEKILHPKLKTGDRYDCGACEREYLANLVDDAS